MKICDILGIGGSSCEIVATDYADGGTLTGYDGLLHISISDKTRFFAEWVFITVKKVPAVR